MHKGVRRGRRGEMNRAIYTNLHGESCARIRMYTALLSTRKEPCCELREKESHRVPQDKSRIGRKVQDVRQPIHKQLHALL